MSGCLILRRIHLRGCCQSSDAGRWCFRGLQRSAYGVSDGVLLGGSKEYPFEGFLMGKRGSVLPLLDHYHMPDSCTKEDVGRNDHVHGGPTNHLPLSPCSLRQHKSSEHPSSLAS